MTRDEPRAIAARLAACLGVPVGRVGDGPSADGAVLLLDAAQLDDFGSERLAAAPAAVVFDARPARTSADLCALRERVQAHGVQIALATFATVPGMDGSVAEAALVVAAPPGDARVAELLAAGPHALALDPAVPVASVGDGDPPARVCVVSFEVSGMTGGGIGTASTSLAEALARHGHDVTLLFTGWRDAGGGEDDARWQAHYAERGVRLEIIRPPGVNTVKCPHFPARSAYEVYRWLRREEPFDVVHLPENMGHGAYAQLAKRQGAAFAETTFVIGTHGPTRWAAEANRVALTREEFLVNDALERISVARADVLLGPSRYLHDYLRARGWTLPERVHVQPYAQPSAVRAGRADPASGDGGATTGLPSEIVFFGRLETRKGVATLCDALDLLAGEDGLPAFEVTFLGPVAQVLGQPADAYIAARAARWPWTWRIVSDRDQQGAAEYLARPGVLAVMPSTVDNAPNTVSEAVALGIPLVAGATGGTGELVAAEQRDDHMFGASAGEPLLPLPLDATVGAPDPRPLAELLRRRLTTPVEPARPPAAPEAVDIAYDRWHRAVRRAREQGDATAAAAGRDLPSLCACVLFDGDEALLAAQLAALAGDEAEVVVADLRSDPSEPPAAAAEHGVEVARPDRPGHAADARAAAVAATRGELFAVVPPNDVPLAAFASALRRAAAATGADVYGCVALDEREDAGATSEEDPAVHAFVPLPGPPLAGLTHPAFTAGPYAIRRDALERLGGFAPDARGDEADHELLNRAAAGGCAIEVVPEPLAAKRAADRWTTFRAVWPHTVVDPPYDAEQWLRVERPFTERDGTALELVGLLRGARGDAQRFEGDLHHQHDVYEDRLAQHRTWIAELQGEVARLRAENVELEKSTVRHTIRVARDRTRRLVHRARR